MYLNDRQFESIAVVSGRAAWSQIRKTDNGLLSSHL